MQKKPLKGEPKRQAVNSLKGYVYQLWQSVYAWLKLKDDELLFLEGAEDFDIVTGNRSEAVQVKSSTKRLGLGSQSTTKAIINFWRSATEECLG